MNFLVATLFILFLATLSVPLAIRFRLPLEVFLVMGTALVSLVPGIPQIEISPLVVFHIFLPPVLFSAAYFTSWRDFKFNFRPITLLAFGLVLVTATAVAIIAKFLLPGFSWAEGFLLGAIVSPSDISAASSILKKFDAPRRYITVLEGESLINDASALILYRFSLIAVFTGVFSLSDALVSFSIMSVGGIVLGIVIGHLSLKIISYLQEPTAETTFTFLIAFLSYLIADYLHLSGVICTVTAGIYFGIKFPVAASSQTRIKAVATWDTIIFVINGFAFSLLGLELPWVAKNLAAYTVWELAWYGFLVSFTVIILRILWVFPVAYIPRWLFPSIAKRDPVPSWKFLFAIGWTGMRGIVPLAAALALPYTVANGTPFPHRDLLIFLTYCVIIATLIPPTLTLPILLRKLKLTEDHSRIREESFARIRAIENVLDKIVVACDKQIPKSILQEFTTQMERKLKVLRTQLEDKPYSSLTNDYVAVKKLTFAALAYEREMLVNLRSTGEIHEDIFHQLSREIDLEELHSRTSPF